MRRVAVLVAEPGTSRSQSHALAPAQRKPDLVTDDRAHKTDCDHRSKPKITSMNSVAREEQYGFAFQQAARKNGNQSVLCDESGERHMTIVAAAVLFPLRRMAG